MNKKDIDRSNDLDINLDPNQEREINILEGPDQNVESLHDLKFEDELTWNSHLAQLVKIGLGPGYLNQILRIICLVDLVKAQ